MKQYIDKDALVAEIERRIESCAKQREDMLRVQCHTLADDASARIGELNYIQDFIENLEVKEVDIEKKATQLSQEYFPDEENVWARPNIEARRCKLACIEMVEWLKAQKEE